MTQVRYRARLYDEDDSTILTPIAGGSHSNQFAVTTHAEHTDGGVTYKPYMGIPQGRRGSLDLLERKVDKGRLSFSIQDPQSGSTQLIRWVTEFLGNADAKYRLLGLKCQLDRSLDGGSTWSTYYTGRLASPSLTRKTGYDFVLKDMGDEIDQPVFVSDKPNNSASGNRESVMPYGFINDYSGFLTATQITFEVKEVSGNYAKLRRTSDKDGAICSSHFMEFMSKFGQPDWFTTSSWNEDEPDLLRCHLTRTSPTALEREFKVVACGLSFAYLGNIFSLTDVRITTLESSSDPDYSAMSALVVGQTVTCWFFPVTPITEGSPVVVNWIHPIAFLEELLAGYYGYRNDDGTPYKAVARVTGSAWDTFRNDNSFVPGKWVIEKEMKLNEFIEKYICQPYNLAYRFNESGLFELIDLRVPNSTGWSTPNTITDADLADGARLTWEADSGQAITRCDFTYYVERQELSIDAWISSMQKAGSYQVPSPAGRISSTTNTVTILTGNTNVKKNVHEIEALGMRGDTVSFLLSFLTHWLYRLWAKRIALDLIYQFGRGAHIIRVFTRNTANTSGLIEGSWVILDINALPDPTSNQRGGARLCRVLEVYDEGPRRIITCIDHGENLEPATPTLGTMAQESGNTKHGVQCSITLNGQGDAARVEMALTDTATGTRPVESSELWQVVSTFASSGTAYARNLPSNTRLWFRARSQPDPTQPFARPSAWVFPGGTGYVDTAAITGPTLVTPTSGWTITATNFFAEWTNGDANYHTQVFVDQGTTGTPTTLHARVSPGSTNVQIVRQIVASTSYRVGVRHIDPYGGVSAIDVQTVTTSSGTNPAPDMVGLFLVEGFEH